jgi:membrane fusion protein, adhesin transport system
MSAFGKLTKRYQRSKWLYPSRVVMIAIAGLITWSWMTPLDEVASADGEVAPQGKIKVIQHLEGGIIRDLMVREGDQVLSGDELMRLELGVDRRNPAELQAELDNLLLSRTPWQAEIKGVALTFDSELAARRPDGVAREVTSFKARQGEIQSALAVARKQITQRKLAIQTLQTKRNATQNDLALAEENLWIATQAVNQGMGTRSELLILQRDVESLKGTTLTTDAEIRQAQADLDEARARVTEIQKRYTNAATERLGDIDRQIAGLREAFGSAEAQTLRTTIRAPIDGIVKKMRYNTLGGVVRPGEAIMEIVPVREELVIEARLDPQDRGYVAVGQPAKIKISTYDFTRYGTLEGIVTLIGADADKDDDGAPYFRVVVQTAQQYLGTSTNPLRISPGMGAEVDIHTGTRTVFQYFIKPLLKLRHDAFRER